MNPPFGGKEGKESQIPYDYKTGATQVLFLQNVLKSMKKDSVCGIVLDEGVLFRTNESGFVQTKRKLLEECNVWCIVSLPGGVFTSAGAGVKTNLMFFTKGQQTEAIWYYDLSDVKVGKKTPLTKAHFDDLFVRLPLICRPHTPCAEGGTRSVPATLAEDGTRSVPAALESERNWTVPFASNLQKAIEEARPLREQAARLAAEAKSLEDTLKVKRKAKGTTKAKLATLEEKWKSVVRDSRENDAKAQTLEDAVYDLKAVNPNKADVSDKRTAAELIEVIQSKGKDADAALGRLRALIAEPEVA